MGGLDLMQSPVYLAPLILSCAVAYSEREVTSQHGIRVAGLPLPLAVAVAAICLNETHVSTVNGAKSVDEWRSYASMYQVELSDRNHRLARLSLKALSILLGAGLLARHDGTNGAMPSFIPTEKGREFVRSLITEVDSAQAAARLGAWWQGLSVRDALLVCGIGG